MRPLLHLGVIAALFLAVVVIGRFPVAVPGPDATPALASAQISLPGLAARAPLDVPDEIAAAPVPLTLFAPQVTEEAIVAAADTTIETTSLLAEQQAAAAADLGLSLTETNPDRTTLFVEYTVAAGDTLSSIGARHGIGVDYIRWNNADVASDASSLQIGEVLQIPSLDGILYDVRVGDTLHDIATFYAADVEELIAFAPNGLSNPNDLREGAQLLVVGGIRPPPSVPVAPEPGDPTGWHWPTVGVITSFKDLNHPLGIDIGVPMRTEITATRAGVVSFVGGDARFSYGYNVRIDHGNGYESRYAHLDSWSVVPGQRVDAGDLVGLSGNTGRSTGPHLHFEINRYNQTLDPLDLLP